MIKNSSNFFLINLILSTGRFYSRDFRFITEESKLCNLIVMHINHKNYMYHFLHTFITLLTCACIIAKNLTVYNNYCKRFLYRAVLTDCNCCSRQVEVTRVRQRNINVQHVVLTRYAAAAAVMSSASSWQSKRTKPHNRPQSIRVQSSPRHRILIILETRRKIY